MDILLSFEGNTKSAGFRGSMHGLHSGCVTKPVSGLASAFAVSRGDTFTPFVTIPAEISVIPSNARPYLKPAFLRIRYQDAGDTFLESRTTDAVENFCLVSPLIPPMQRFSHYLPLWERIENSNYKESKVLVRWTGRRLIIVLIVTGRSRSGLCESQGVSKKDSLRFPCFDGYLL